MANVLNPDTHATRDAVPDPQSLLRKFIRIHYSVPEKNMNFYKIRQLKENQDNHN